MCDDWDDNAAIETTQACYENRPISSQRFSNSNFRGARGNSRNNDRNTRFQRNSRDNNSHGNSENFSSRSNGLYRNNRFQENKTWGNSSNVNENNQSETLNVPSKFIGRIIGRGGSKINELQADSGARIQVTKDIIGDDTVVKIFGSHDSIDKAKSLINSLTTEMN